jgi:N-acetylglutamate synthase-like GNAT family acetyltransferase
MPGDRRSIDSIEFRRVENVSDGDCGESIRALLTEAKIGIGEDWNSYPYWTAFADGEVVGCASLVFVDSVCIFHSLAVRKLYRRMRIGSGLVERRIDESLERGATVALLMTMFWNVNFFRRFGFETTSRKLLPPAVAHEPLIFDPTFRKATPMIRMLRESA